MTVTFFTGVIVLPPPAFKREQPKNRASLWWARNRGRGETQRQGSTVGAIRSQKTVLETSRTFPDRLCNVVTAKGRQPIWGEQTSGS